MNNDGLYFYEKGLTVVELKELIAKWPDHHADGRPTEVWIGFKNDSYPARAVWDLDLDVGVDGVTASDMLFTND